MRKKITLVLLILLITVATTVIFAACDKEVAPIDPNKPTVIERDACDLVFGADGITYKGILAPEGSDPAIGGAVVATAPLTASGADLNVDATIIKLNITLLNGQSVVLDTTDAIAQILRLDFATGFTTSNGKFLTKDTPSDCTFKFTMAATDDLTYVGANFAITVRVTVTHADGQAV